MQLDVSRVWGDVQDECMEDQNSRRERRKLGRERGRAPLALCGAVYPVYEVTARRTLGAVPIGL